MKNLKLCGDLILIEIEKKQEIKGFMTPENLGKSTSGKVILVGNGKIGEKTIEVFIKPGDIIYFHEWSAKPFKNLCDEYEDNIFFIKQSEIIGFKTNN